MDKEVVPLEVYTLQKYHFL